jgi:NADH-quinone oxidoreductase subunit M
MSHLDLVLFMPLVGFLLMLFTPKDNPNVSRWTALAISIAVFAVSLLLLAPYWFAYPTGYTFETNHAWINFPPIHYHVGLDGLSLWLVLLSTFLTPIAVAVSWKYIDKRVKEYFAFLILLEFGLIGVFVSVDLFLFYVFWEIALVPMYFLIGIWGHDRRIYATVKFFLYTMAGSVLMLGAIIYLYNQTGTFDYTVIRNLISNGHVALTTRAEMLLFLAFFVAFAVKVPLFPLHTWLPDAHVEAPTAISVILAGVLLKMGTYGILRINFSILPAASHEFAFWLLGVIGTINIVYGALCAMAQTDYKKLIAYSSVSHMGYVMLGMAALTTAGINGAVLQMFNHGTITAMLFLLVGVIYDRTHHREIAGFGGLASQMPMYAALTGFAFFAAMGLPGLSAFISEVLVLIGAWQRYPVMTVLGAGTTILTAGYMLWTFQRIYLGPLNEKYKNLSDLTLREAFMLVPLAIIVLILGVYPHAILDLLGASLNHVNQIVLMAHAPAAAMVP